MRTHLNRAATFKGISTTRDLHVSKIAEEEPGPTVDYSNKDGSHLLSTDRGPSPVLSGFVSINSLNSYSTCISPGDR